MANYANLLATIAANIYTNHNNEVTASMVKTAVDQMVTSLGDGYQFAGVATPTTDPGTPDEQVFYIAGRPGTYTDFGSIVVGPGELAILYGSGTSWSKGSALMQQFLFADGVACVKELYINADGVAAGLTTLNNIITGASYRVRFTDGLNYIGSTPSGITDIDDARGILPIISDADGVTIFGYVIVDWEAIPSPPPTVRTLSPMAYNIDYSPAIARGAVADELGYESEEAASQEILTAIADMILTGEIYWMPGFRAYASGDFTANASFVCTKRLPAQFLPYITNSAGVGGSDIYRYHRCYLSLWEDGVYVGYKLYGQFYDPSSTIVSDIPFDEFTLSVQKSDVPAYATEFRVFRLGSVSSANGKYDFSIGWTALGDSTTAGAYSDDGKTSWADIAATICSFPSYLKLAKGGCTCVQVTGLPHLSTQVGQIPNSFDGLVTIMIGVNDVGQGATLGDVDAVLAESYANLNDTTDFATAFRYNIETIKRNFPQARVLVLLPLAVGDDAQWPLITEASVEQFREVERKICEALAVPYIEPAKEAGISAILGTTYWDTFMADKVHPNTPGYTKIAGWVIGKLIEYAN